MAQHCKVQGIEIGALQLSFGTLNICILTLYRAPSGNFGSFLLKLDTILQTLYTPKLHFIICGDININYLNDSENKNQLDNLLLSYNLISIINFPTRVQNTSATAIDNISIAVSQLESYMVTPIINGMSDHDAQLLIISTHYSHVPINKLKTIRKINKFTISDFIDKFSCKSWDYIFNSAILSTASTETKISTEARDCQDLIQQLEGKHKQIALQWIPGHCQITGNEQADVLAKKSAKITQTYIRGTRYHSIKLHLKQAFRTVYRHELETRSSHKPWLQEISKVTDGPRRRAVAEF